MADTLAIIAVDRIAQNRIAGVQADINTLAGVGVAGRIESNRVAGPGGRSTDRIIGRRYAGQTYRDPSAEIAQVDRAGEVAADKVALDQVVSGVADGETPSGSAARR